MNTRAATVNRGEIVSIFAGLTTACVRCCVGVMPFKGLNLFAHTN